jgi:undecaprenyl-diphosphatase
LLLASAALSLVALALSIAVTIRKAPLPGDRSIIRQVQGWTWFEPIARFVNGVADHNFALLAAILVGATLAAIVRKHAGDQYRLLLVALLLQLYVVNHSLKLIIRSPRPSATNGIQVDAVRDSFGFPSGHVYSSVLVCAAITFLLSERLSPRTWRALTAVLIVWLAAVGFARVFAGAHWPVDVLGGYLWGFAALTLWWSLAAWFTRNARMKSAGIAFTEPRPD